MNLIPDHFLKGLLVERVTLDADDGDHRCLVHLITDYMTNPGLAL